MGQTFIEYTMVYLVQYILVYLAYFGTEHKSCKPQAVNQSTGSIAVCKTSSLDLFQSLASWPSQCCSAGQLLGTWGRRKGYWKGGVLQNLSITFIKDWCMYIEIRGCSHIMSANFGGFQTPPPSSSFVTFLLSPLPPFVILCQHLPDPPLLIRYYDKHFLTW